MINYKKILFIYFLFISTLFSHPHTFIDVYPTIEVKNAKTETIHFEWVLDDMSSSMLIMEYDQNGDNVIDKDENYFIYKNYFSIYETSNFYTEIKINDKVQTVEPKNFRTTIKDNRIHYSFDIEKNYETKNLTIDFADKDFFHAMILKKEFVNIKGAKAIVNGVDNDFYFAYRLELKELVK